MADCTSSRLLAVTPLIWGLRSSTRTALGVAAHAGRGVVEFEELGQRLGVELLLFEGGDEGQLRAHESLAAAAEAGQ